VPTAEAEGLDAGAALSVQAKASHREQVQAVVSSAAQPNPSVPISTSTGVEVVPAARAAGTFAAGLAALAAGHMAVDCCTGIWPVFKTLAHLDLDLAGAIATAAGLIANGLQVAFGLLGDRGLAKKLMVGGVLLAGAVTLAPLTQSYAVLFALVLATSLGSAAFHPIAAGSAAGLSTERTGVLMALFLAGGYAGYSMSQLAFTAAYRVGPAAPALLLVVPALAAAGITRFVPAARRRSQTLAAWTRSVRGVARPLSALFSVQALAGTINTSIVFLLPDLLLQRGVPAFVAQGGGHFALVIGAVFALVPAGHATDRLGARRVLVVTNLATGALLALVLAGSWSPAVLLVLLAGFGAFNSANNVVAVSAGNRLLPGQSSGVSALLMGVPWCVAALGPLVSGLLADPRRGGDPTRALAWMGIVIPLALVASLFTGQKKPTVA
jgi:FSR family fosmidomycin resistance protein-like MFS transporter